jgi:hypothetical protein
MGRTRRPERARRPRRPWEGDEEEYPLRPKENPATYVPIAHDLMAVRQRYLGRFGFPSGPPLFDE